MIYEHWNLSDVTNGNNTIHQQHACHLWLATPVHSWVAVLLHSKLPGFSVDPL
jgi:hypothetical protein